MSNPISYTGTPPVDAGPASPLDGGPTFSLKHRLFRVVWGVVWAVFAAWTPPPLHRWRRWLLVCFGADLHATARVYGSARVWYPPHLTMERHATLGPQVHCYCMAPIRLGEHALVSQGAHLCAGTHAIDDPRFPLVVKPITVRAGAWVAAEAFIGPGVTVGTGAVLGARAVLFRDAEDFGVYVGNPAVRVRRRKSGEESQHA